MPKPTFLDKIAATCIRGDPTKGSMKGPKGIEASSWSSCAALIYFVGRFYFSRGARRRAFRVGPHDSLVDPWARVMASPSGALCVGGGRTATTGRCPAASRHTHDPDDLSPPDPPVSPVGLVLSSSLSQCTTVRIFLGEKCVCVFSIEAPKVKLEPKAA